MERTCCTLSPTPAVEDALRALFVLEEQEDPGSTPLLARHLRITPQDAASIVDRLAEHRLVDRTADHRATLTRHGAAHARHVVRRYRLLGVFLTQVLTLTPDEARAEADVWEHVASDRLLDRIDMLLGRPGRDPCGFAVPQPREVAVAGWNPPLGAVGPLEVLVP
jgi:DtxR family transcriptional regulator, Mn-dependent transcriptional regulator